MTELDERTRSRMRPEDLAYLQEIADGQDISLGDALKIVIMQIEAESARTSKTISENKTRRVYRTPAGHAVSCSIQHQRAYDPDDGQQAGWYGWCGPVDDQSDYMIGPYDSAAEVFAAYERRHPRHVRCSNVKLHRAFIGPDMRFHGKGPEFTPIESN